MMRINPFSSTVKTIDGLKKVNERFNQKVSGTFIERAINYLKNVYVDYKEVGTQVRSDIKAKPFKASLFFTGFGVFAYALSHNPNEKSFKAKFIECTNDVCLVSSEMVNPSAVEHLKYIQTCYNHDLIRYTSLGLFSIIWVDKYSDQCDIYETNCSYLKPSFTKFSNQILDVGFWNIWWVISRKMLDYDINY